MGKLAGWALVFSVISSISMAQSAMAAENIADNQPCGPTPIVISELQASALGANSRTNYRYEFVEIYNCASVTVDLASYSLVFSTAEDVEITRLDLSGEIEPESFLWAVHGSYAAHLGESTLQQPYIVLGSSNLNALPAEGGYVALVDTTDPTVEVPVDSVAYGTVEDALLPAAPLPPTGQSIKRCTGETGFFVNTTDNSFDFAVTALPTLSALFKMGPVCNDPIEEAPPEEELQPVCQGITLSELLPNATGADGGQEFIEVYNPTDEALPLLGCVLRLNEHGKEFVLPDETLEPGAYRAFYDDETGITLPNAAGGTAWLLLTSEKQSVPYPDLKEDQAWAMISGQWKATLKPTPGAANQLVLPQVEPEPKSENREKNGGLKPCAANQQRNPETNRCRLISSNQPSRSPCSEGQERNPATNRCRSVLSSASNSLTPCKAGQERNTGTNRCRSIVSTAATSLVPCKTGQTRNPATNRCRSTTSATTTYKPCAANQERNPATNRCRLAASTGNTLGIAEVKDVATGPVAANPRWWLAGAAVLAAATYGAFEWRQEIKGMLSRLKRRPSSGTPLR